MNISPILADTITADMGFLPGLAMFGPAFGLPLSVLASVLERPFYTRAGIGKWAIWYSLQANLISLLIGYLLLPIAIMTLDSIIGLLWLPVSVFVSIVVERKYLKWRARTAGFNGGWMWVSWANVFSALALVGVLMLSWPFDTDQNKLALFPYRDGLMYFGIGVSVIAFAIAFTVPAVGGRRANRPAANATIAGDSVPLQ